MNDKLSEYINIFIEESIEYIEQLDILLIDLEKNKTDKMIIKKIYRVMHTIKGISGIVGFTELSTFMHAAESILDRILNDELSINEKLIRELYNINDLLKIVINDLQTKKEIQIDLKSEIKKFQNFISTELSQDIKDKKIIKKEPTFHFNLLQYKDKIIEGINQNNKIYKIEFIINKDEELKKSRKRIFEKRLSIHGEILDSFPKREKDYYAEDELKIQLLFLGIINDIAIEKMNRVDRIHNFIFEEISPENLLKEKATFVPKKEIKTMIDENRIKVKVEKLDKLLNYAQELTIANLSLRIIIDKIKEEKHNTEQITELENTTDMISKTTQTLHQEIMQARMIPMGNLFRRFYRPVRDMSNSSGKKISLKISGEEEEIDKSTIDILFEPLLHIVRNAIEHGIETPQQRNLLSKNEEAVLEMKSYSKHNRLFIEIFDDGKGIDIEGIRNKAIEKGIISENEELNKSAIIDLMFRPNFSTKKIANEIAGRGMGMNIVQEALKKTNGDIRVETEKDKGTTITISLPATLTIVSSLIIETSKEKYAIPLSSIAEIISVPRRDVKSVCQKKMIGIRDKSVPLIHLEEYFELEYNYQENNEITILVIDTEMISYGLIVENIIEKQEIVTKPISYSFLQIPGIEGMTIIGDGSIVLILDVNTIANYF